MASHLPARRAEPWAGVGELETDFAMLAGREGWRKSTLDRFCGALGISETQRRTRWPKGVRSIGWQLNERADEVVFEHFTRSGALPLSQILLQRFRSNEPLRLSVRRLAYSDAFHPADTWARTMRTVKLMWQCQDIPLRESFLRSRLREGMLGILYSGCVIVWLIEPTSSGAALRTAIRLTVKIVRVH